MKKLLLSLALLLLLSGVSLADEATDDMEDTNKHSFSLSAAGNFGKYDIKYDDREKQGDLHNQSNIGLTYLYHVEALDNIFSFGGKFMISNYGSRVTVRKYNPKFNDYYKTSIAIKPAYTLMLMANLNVYNISNFSTNVNIGLGVSMNTLQFKDTYEDYNNSRYNRNMLHSANSYVFLYRMQAVLNRTYNINKSWGVGLDLNYTSLGDSSVKIKGNYSGFEVKAISQNNDFGIGLSVKYSF